MAIDISVLQWLCLAVPARSRLPSATTPLSLIDDGWSADGMPDAITCRVECLFLRQMTASQTSGFVTAFPSDVFRRSRGRRPAPIRGPARDVGPDLCVTSACSSPLCVGRGERGVNQVRQGVRNPPSLSGVLFPKLACLPSTSNRPPR